MSQTLPFRRGRNHVNAYYYYAARRRAKKKCSVGRIKKKV